MLPRPCRASCPFHCRARTLPPSFLKSKPQGELSLIHSLQQWQKEELPPVTAGASLEQAGRLSRCASLGSKDLLTWAEGKEVSNAHMRFRPLDLANSLAAPQAPSVRQMSWAGPQKLEYLGWDLLNEGLR